MADKFEREDPVLVRPYITTQPGDRQVQTWPATADLPEDGTPQAAGAAAPPRAADAAAKTTALRRQRLVVLAAVGALAMLGGLGLFLLRPAGDDHLPATARPAPPAPGASGSPAAAPAASAATISVAPSPGAGRSAATTPPATPATTGAAVGPGQAPGNPPASGAPAPTLTPPPATPRTGPVTAAGGRCLNLGGLLALDGTPVQTAGCADVNYQRWTLAADGTLLVAGRCARVAADATVRIGGCDDQPAGQWRAGPHGSLVNPGTRRCLTDPGRPAVTVTVTDCTGAADQAWTLP
ncbi:hypothetical protein GCM10020358_19070 [Amorphoplanes nipponensis]|uniref:Ricin B lectin domain-containing protein n=1 Tax=Actinoplanes nipponensis TaxID=135950 RepID=A0A919JGN9_9ACTN|nr:RICIN domain-containing protein [Actinoplanes nipponensis]GIE50443.1 hypothetical protein Ani05nite_39770 [Actinoplanes nipponensis]